MKHGLILTIIIFSLLSLASCVSQKKVERYLDSHQELLAKNCVEKFPAKDSIIVKDSVRLDTVNTEGPWITDTVFIKGDTVVRKSQCPPTQTIYKTIRHDSLIIRVDQAQVYLAQSGEQKALAFATEMQTNNDLLTGDLADMKHSRNKWRFYFFALLAVAVGWQFRKGIAGFILHFSTGL